MQQKMKIILSDVLVLTRKRVNAIHLALEVKTARMCQRFTVGVNAERQW